jgi:hypothetical protein
MEEFEKLVSESFQSDLWPLPEAASATGARPDSSPRESAPGELADAESDKAETAGASGALDQPVATGENDPAA